MHLTKYAVAGAQCRYKRFEEGEIISQVLLGNDYSICVHHFLIKQTIRLHPFTKNNILALHYMMQGNIHATLQGFVEIQLEQGKYQLFYIPGSVIHEATFTPGFYYSFHVNFHPTHLVPIARQYAVFEPMLSKAKNGIKAGEQLIPGFITPEIKELIRQVLHNSLSPAEKVLFLESSIRNLLRIYVHEFAAREDRSLVSDPQLRLLKEVTAYIESNLDKRLSVDVLASKFNISRSWLQQVSKNHHGKGIHSQVKQMRMEAAARLLLNTDHSVGNIVMMVSDMTFAAFSASFHEYYGQAPLQYRKNRGQKL